MGLLISRSDFTGFYKVPKDCFDKLDGFISEFERGFIEDLLGCALATLLIDDLDPGPSSPRFKAIIDRFCDDEVNGCDQNKSEGMVKAIVGLVYKQFVDDSDITLTSSGPTTLNVSTSKSLSPMRRVMFAERRYNRALESYVAIQVKVKLDTATYPEYKGTEKSFSFYGGAI